ncbi:MAG: DMT family transporter [Desulfobacterota bacterium]|nr:DMT family transporter [Thermodesulfobacteriota bacterium]
MKKPKGKLTLEVFFLIILTDVIESFAELFWKKGALATGIDNVTFANVTQFMSSMLTGPEFLTGLFLYIVNFFLWVTVLSRVDLSVAFPTGSTSYIIVALLSMVFLDEHISLYRWSGIICIITGIYFISKSANDGGSPA